VAQGRWRIIAWAAVGLLLVAGLAQAGDLGVDEAALSAAGEAYELNAAPGALVLTDYGADEIRRIDPSTGAYTAYTVAAPVDGRQDAQGRIWFTSAESRFGFISPGAGTITTWSAGDPAELTLSGVAFDAVGRVWLTEWFGSDSALRRFDPATRELCAWAFSGGVSSYYALVSGGFVWTANWANDRLVRFDPVSGQGRRWSLGVGSDPLGIATDPAGDLWAAAAEQGQLLRLAPASDLLTRYALPAGEKPQIIASIGSVIWYTEGASGTVGSLDPSVAAGSSAVAGSDTFTAAPTCSTLPAGSVAAATARSASLAWSGGAWNEIVAAGGWTVYQLPAGANPFGIASYAGAPWVVDQGRQVIARPGGPVSTETPTPTATHTATRTPTITSGPSLTPTRTPTATGAVTPGPSPTPSGSPSPAPTVTPGPSPTPTVTSEATAVTPPPFGMRTYLPLMQR
jgi:streptogramin lyase